MKTNKAAKLLKDARAQARIVSTWADLSNVLFDPLSGLVARAFPSEKERRAFARTKEYKEIRDLISQARERTGLVEGATPRKTNRFIIQLPESLHAALQIEAAEEGVQVSQLIVAKLSTRLKQIVSK